jgi:hypothetical protein
MTHNIPIKEKNTQEQTSADAARIAQLEREITDGNYRIKLLENQVMFLDSKADLAAQNDRLYEARTRELETTIKNRDRQILVLVRDMDSLTTLARELEAQVAYLRQEKRNAAEREAALRHHNACIESEMRLRADHDLHLSGVDLGELQPIELAELVANIQSALVAAKLALARSQGALAGAADSVEVEFPDTKCPITTAIMEDPVLTADGQSYERHAITRWFAQQIEQGLPRTSPSTNIPLASVELYPNHSLRKLIQALCAAQCDRAEHPGAPGERP